MQQPKPSDVLSAAIDYASRGLAVIPIIHGKKIPACQNGVKDATSMHDRIRQWWTKTPDAGVGIAGGGAARIVVIDVDGDEGRVSLASIEAAIGTLPTTACATTPRGGEHRYFRFPASSDISRVKNSVGKLGAKIDIRAVNGYVVAPPTPGYAWSNTEDIAELSDAWVQRILNLDGKSSVRYGEAALRSACEQIRNAAEGTRNDTLNREAFSLGGLIASGAISEHVVRSALIGAGCDAGLSESEAQKSTDSGLRAGREKPRDVPDSAPPAAQSKSDELPDWTKLLRYDRRGQLSKDPSNVLILLTCAPQWTRLLSWDSFLDVIRWVGDPPPVDGPAGPMRGEALADHHVTWVQYALSRLHGASFSTEAVMAALQAAARQSTTHALREWLTGLRWDGIPRVNGWLNGYLGAPDTPYVSKVGRWWLISCAARVAVPGAQVDHMLVLEGPQGAGKSSAVRILGGEYYLGSIPDLREKKSAAETLRGRWIVEIGELDALRGSAATRVKDFLSQTVDYYRPAYGRLPVARARECCFVATTNETSYLADATGGRRFWPVPVGGVRREALETDRDQIWAEAWHLYHAGAQWWPEDGDTAELAAEQEERFQEDTWEAIIAKWAETRTSFTIGEVLESALKIDKRDWDKSVQTRCGAVLHRLGYYSKQARINGAKVRLYEPA